MSVKPKTKGNKLILEIDKKDKKNIEDVINEWKFKDEQSLLRFFISIARESLDKKTISYKDECLIMSSVVPADHLLK